MAEGHTRLNPFAAFVTDSPSALKEMLPAEEAEAVHRQVAALRRRNTVSKAILQGAETAEKAARAVEAALAPLEHLQQTLRKARQRRDGIGETWDAALAALKRGARAAVDDGAPGLYDALFGRFGRPTRKKPPAPAPAVTTASPASPQAVDAAT